MEKERENVASKMDTIEKQLEDTIRHNFKSMNDKIDKLSFKHNEVVTKDKNVQEKVEEVSLTASFNDPVQGIRCDQCDFVAKTNSSLKTHKTRKHTVVSPGKFSKKCTFCDKTFKNKNDYKHHVIYMHSCTKIGNTSYKCKECKFIAKNYTTLQVHLGKTHTETLECGLCETEFENLDNLELHIKTCEVYQCRHCQKRELSISTIKDHIKIHIQSLGHGMLDHLKMSRYTPNLVTEKFYWDYQI